MRVSKRTNVTLNLSGWTASREDETQGAEHAIARIFAHLVRIRPATDENTLSWLDEVQVAFVPPGPDEDVSHLEFRVYPQAEEGDYSTEVEAEEDEGEIGVPDPIATVRVYQDGRIEH